MSRLRLPLLLIGLYVGCDVVEVAEDHAPPFSRSGSLESTDDGCSVGRSPCDEHELEIAARRPTTISVSSSDFDTYVCLRSQSGEALRCDDDSGGNLDSRIVTTLPAGEYRVEVTAFLGIGQGDYRLDVE